MRKPNDQTVKPTRGLSAGTIAAFACLPFTGFASSSARADVVVYSNVTNFGGSFFSNGATTAIGSPTSVDYTPYVADDISPLTGYEGAPVTSITFSVVNVTGAAVVTNVDLAFYDSNGAGSGPGTLLADIPYTTPSQATGTIQLYTVTSATGFFALPTSDLLWAGLAFSDGGNSTVTTTQLASLGQGLFDPPTIGSSQDVFFNASPTTDTTGSNPTGTFNFFGGPPQNPVANFGWSFSVTPVPEPTTLALGAVAAAGLLARRRRA